MSSVRPARGHPPLLTLTGFTDTGRQRFLDEEAGPLLEKLRAAAPAS